MTSTCNSVAWIQFLLMKFWVNFESWHTTSEKAFYPPLSEQKLLLVKSICRFEQDFFASWANASGAICLTNYAAENHIHNIKARRSRRQRGQKRLCVSQFLSCSLNCTIHLPLPLPLPPSGGTVSFHRRIVAVVCLGDGEEELFSITSGKTSLFVLLSDGPKLKII